MRRVGKLGGRREAVLEMGRERKAVGGGGGGRRDRETGLQVREASQ